jgi:hypothetical protein
MSPIDRYLDASRGLVVLAGQSLGGAPNAPLAAHQPEVGRLLVLGIVAEVEMFFRGVLGELVAFCPVCIERIGDEPVPLRSVLNHGVERVGQGLFNDVSFASRRNVETQTARVSGLVIKGTTSLVRCLTDFEALCHVRHAATHSAGELGLHNRAELRLKPGLRFSVAVNMQGFDAAAAACHNLVRAYNSSLYQHVVGRWIATQRIRKVWAADKELFGRLYHLFYSARDAVGPSTAYHAYQSLLTSL